jgi:hypothetical protein
MTTPEPTPPLGQRALRLPLLLLTTAMMAAAERLMAASVWLALRSEAIDPAGEPPPNPTRKR